MTAVVDGYRLARQAQDERFNARPGAGGVDASCVDTDEYREYFGMGEWSGGGVEPRLTFKTYLQGTADPEPTQWITERAAFVLPGDVLREAALNGDPVAGREIGRRRAKRAAKRASREAGVL